jgi:hypothetical protein
MFFGLHCPAKGAPFIFLCHHEQTVYMVRFLSFLLLSFDDGVRAYHLKWPSDWITSNASSFSFSGSSPSFLLWLMSATCILHPFCPLMVATHSPFLVTKEQMGVPELKVLAFRNRNIPLNIPTNSEFKTCLFAFFNPRPHFFTHPFLMLGNALFARQP